MKEKSIIVMVPLNISHYYETGKEDKNLQEFGNHLNREKNDEEWICNRIKIFMNYTLKSLKLQTNQHFKALVVYSEATKELVLQELNKYDPLPSNIKFIEFSLLEDEIKKTIKKSKYFYFVRTDSDDMYHKTYIQRMQDYTPEKYTTALINPYGYLYDSTNNKLAKCKARVTSCYTLIFNSKDYLEGKTYNVVTDQIDSQMWFAWSYFPREILMGRNYVWHVHSKNTITNFEQWFTDTWVEELKDITTDEAEIEKVLKDYI
ncbi:putative rhamnosyl transferase [Clostridium swellfunianum]|uniref:glycosyltransferase family A protein n=1 Tax=Clostridium swellfunianum TaxID=1367462 RepID=UPI00202FACEE|nr:glycosyltransferase family A protein [Clostridium swellfunianum]MCM0647380.1 putative rhamnosyl transferase [Clostridium swellfunianum]